ncbi:MAG: sulfotransferase [Gammaproteobacteria bacterium]|nr:sulfotransferase [Gammaproteobacteria bacterium]
MNSIKPGFFILGAPSCGTTSLYKWLILNPHIFMPSHKEPNYFSNCPQTHSLDDYESLFEGCPAGALAVGEASTQYLRCPDAVARILRYNAQARFIVMVRNPVEMAYSWHNRKLAGAENVLNFEKAWNLRNKRKAGLCIPPCRDPKELIYDEMCKLGEQLQHVYRQASPGRVHVVVFDDLKADAAGVYQSVLRFLQVPDDDNCLPNFEVHNAARKIPRYRLMARLVKPAFGPLGRLKAAAGFRRSWGIYQRILRPEMGPRPPMPPRVRQMLAEYFRDDVRLLEQLIERDLSHWIEVS